MALPGVIVTLVSYDGPGCHGTEAPEAEQRILGGETVVTKWRVTNAGDG